MSMVVVGFKHERRAAMPYRYGIDKPTPTIPQRMYVHPRGVSVGVRAHKIRRFIISSGTVRSAGIVDGDIGPCVVGA